MSDLRNLTLRVLSLRYSSWSMRPWLALTHAGADFKTVTVALPDMQRQGDTDGALSAHTSAERQSRRALGSVHGLFPVLSVGNTAIHESLAICEYAAELFPQAGLWPKSALARAQARAVSCEMSTGFQSTRGELSSHLFGRVPDFTPSAATAAELDRLFELWTECLQRSGGPFLFGAFCIADAMYYPMLTRLRTYGIALPASLTVYADAMEAQPAVEKLLDHARSEPRIPIYDRYLQQLGGDPDAALV